MSESDVVSPATNGLPPLKEDAVFDKGTFNQSVSMLVVGVACNRGLSRLLEQLRPYFPPFVHIPKLQKTYTDDAGVLRKLTLLQPTSSIADSEFIADLKKRDIDVSLKPYFPPDSSCRQNEANAEEPPEVSISVLPSVHQPCSLRLKITYENFSFEHALKLLLPDHLMPVSGFTAVGHVAHFNLKPDALPYRHLIGQLALDKLPNIRTVIHKASAIESDYRTFEMELMAGEPNYVTVVRENNLSFHLDMSKVYWNSRLGTEHARIVERIRHPLPLATEHDDQTVFATRTVVYDVFAGVGPFAVPAAKLGCDVFANDLNPESYKWLLKNVTVNKTKRKPLENVKCFNLDGRVFIREILLPHYWKSLCSSEPPQRFVVIMNLPALAPEFLDAFSVDGEYEKCDPTVPLEIFCYCFLRRHIESEDTVKQRIANALHCVDLFGEAAPNEASMTVKSWNFRFVRDVAPYKDMYCAEFQLMLARKEANADSLDCCSGEKKPRWSISGLTT